MFTSDSAVDRETHTLGNAALKDRPGNLARKFRFFKYSLNNVYFLLFFFVLLIFPFY